jgi:DNA-binding MarR family transcriptional regulator
MDRTDADERFRSILGRLMGLTAREFRRRLDHNLSDAGHELTATQVIMLKNIDLSEGASQQTISDLLCWDKTAVTRAIDVLEEKNLVIRVQDKNDRRQNMIYLTPMAKDKISNVMEIALITEAQALAGVDPERIKICKDVLRQAYANLTGQEGPQADKIESS